MGSGLLVVRSVVLIGMLEMVFGVAQSLLLRNQFGTELV